VYLHFYALRFIIMGKLFESLLMHFQAVHITSYIYLLETKLRIIIIAVHMMWHVSLLSWCHAHSRTLIADSLNIIFLALHLCLAFNMERLKYNKKLWVQYLPYGVMTHVYRIMYWRASFHEFFNPLLRHRTFVDARMLVIVTHTAMVKETHSSPESFHSRQSTE